MPLLLAAILGGFYWLRRCPSYGGGDSAQHALSALTLGVSRPPGYPLYVFLGHAFAAVAPGPRAAAMAGFSALTAAAAVGLLYAVLKRQGFRDAAAALAAALMAGAPLHWFYAEVPEVRALNHALALAALAAACAWSVGPSAASWFCLAAALGLGLSHHPTFVFILPAVFWATGPKRPTLRQWAVLAAGLGFFLLLPYAALWLRLRWGGAAYNPDAVRGLCDVGGLWLRKNSGGFWRLAGAGPSAFDVARLGRHAGWFAAAAARDLTPIGLLLAGVGVWELARKQPRQAGTWALWFILPVAGYFAFSSRQLALFDPRYERAVVERFFTLPMIGGFALAAAGAQWLAQRTRPAFVWALALAAAARLAVAPVDLRGREPLHAYVGEVLATTGPRDFIVPASDDLAFALRYADVVEGRLADRVILMPWLLGYAPYEEELKRRHPDLQRPAAATAGDPKAWAAANPGRVVFAEAADPAARGWPAGSLIQLTGKAPDPVVSARAFLDSSLARLTRWDVDADTQQVVLLADARRLAAAHLERLPQSQKDLRSRLRLAAALF